MADALWLSASALRTFKACPIRYRNRYVYGIKPEFDTDLQRIGTNWHECLEELAGGGTSAVLAFMEERYSRCPFNKTQEMWDVERNKLLYSCYAYDWYYKDQENYDVISTELPFELPLINRRGKEVEDCILNGRIDKLIRNKNGVPMVMEHKSTSGDVGSDSDFWKGLAMDTQSMLYIYVARRLQLAGALEKFGLKASDPLICGCMYDAWRKPQIKQKKLSKSDTNKLIKEQSYFDTEFTATQSDNPVRIDIDGVPANFEMTVDKKMCVYETPDMYGARLIAAEYETPAKYFGRRELSFTNDQMNAYELELAGIYMNIVYMRKMGTWFTDETSCEEKFKCDYIGTCYNGLDILKHVPAGYKGPREEYKI